MNVYIVDDRPQTLLSLVAQMVKNGFHVQTVFVYFERKEDADNRKVKTLENQFTALGVTLRIITDNDFHTVLDEIYMDPNALFLFDFDLSPERSFYCGERINVQYALGKLQWNRTISKSGSIPQAPFPWLHKYIICLVIGLFRWNDLIQ